MPDSLKPDDKLSEAEADARFDRAIKNALATPPKPHKPGVFVSAAPAPVRPPRLETPPDKPKRNKVKRSQARRYRRDSRR